MRRPAVIGRLAVAVALILSGSVTPAPAAAVQGSACQPSTHWTAGEVTVWWFDVEQGDAQLIIGAHRFAR